MASRVKQNATKSTGGGKPGKVVPITGTEGADTLYGTDGNDTIDGRGGNDTLVGAGGNDYLLGGLGDDYFDGGSNYDQMDGGAGNDTFVVDHLSDLVIERIDGGTDTVLSSVNYALSQYLENLTLTGGSAFAGTGNHLDNRISGSAADNRLDGREGNDVIDGGQGADVLIGGLGADTFAFTTAGSVDQILDFETGFDRIALDDAVFGGLLPGALPAEAFRLGSAAQDADDRILYDPATGTLAFDADGAGGVAAVAFATLQPGLALSAADFAVI